MKTLLQFINEATITDLEEILKSNDISIDDAITTILRHQSRKRAQDLTEFNEFFKRHGLNNLNWGRRNNAVKQFINCFAEDNKLDILSEIVENDGVVSIDDIKTTGNIFDLCKGFEEEAKIICSWVNGKNRPSGPGEILLNFLIKDATSPEEGDISINGELMEVKSNTININFKTGQKTRSGGIPVGQKGDIRKSWAVYSYLHTALTNKTYKSGYFDSFNYFQNSKGFNEFNIFLQSLNISDTRKITDTITDAFLYQYKFIGNENERTNEISNYQIKKLKDEVFKQLNPLFNKDNTINDETTFINVIGAIQLYLYSVIEGFSYFMCLLYDKDINNESRENGKYVFLKADELLDFGKVLEHLTFNKFAASATKSEGRAGKIFLK